MSMLALLSSCNGVCGGSCSNKSNLKSITVYSLNGVTGVITGQNISVTMPYGTDLTALVATFTTTGTSVTVNGVMQTSKTTPNDFTSPVVYTVTAADGTTYTYAVTVTIASSSAKAITAFSLPSLNGPVNALISGQSISVTMPYGTDLKALVATFTTTGTSVTVSGLIQISETTPNNFTAPIIYTVTAADGTTDTYTVTVTVASSSAKAITAFSLPSLNGTVNAIINGQNILLTMPSGTSKEFLSSLIATFTTTGASVAVNGAIQTSETTPNNFTVPVIYTVTAADGTTDTYTVTVSVTPSSAKAITSYSLNGTTGVITGQNISVIRPYGSDVTALKATFITTGASVMVNGIIQTNEITPNDFTSPVIYTVIAADGTTNAYTVTVTVPSVPFVAYYPNGCTLGVDCDCVQDTATHDVWTVTTSVNRQCYNSLMDENGTCPSSAFPPPSVAGYIPALNNGSTCGFTDNGWDLPSQTQLQTMANYVSSQPDGSKGNWFNTMGFSGIENLGVYFGQCDGNNCTLPSGDGGGVWIMDMNNGIVDGTKQVYTSPYSSGWGVHSGQ